MEGTATGAPVVATVAATVKTARAIECSTVRLKVPAMVRYRCKPRTGAASLHGVIRHHEALRVMIECDRNPRRPHRCAFSYESILDLMPFHVRFGDARQWHRDLVAKLLGRFLQKLDRMVIAERDALNQVVVFRIHGENRGLPVHG